MQATVKGPVRNPRERSTRGPNCSGELMEEDLTWEEDLLARFPGWQSDAAAKEWPAVKASLAVGQPISGIVVARAPFGVWLDIGVPLPALLLVPEMREAKQQRITFADYPPKGEEVHGRILHLGDRGQISITQQELQVIDQPRVAQRSG
jgi:hypothetical protein